MYKTTNIVVLCGRLRDPLINYDLDSGGQMAIMHLDVEYEWLDTQTQTSETRIETHPIAIFNPYTIEYLNKFQVGSAFLVEGCLQGRAYTSKDGTEKFVSRLTIGKKHGKVLYMGQPRKTTSATGSTTNEVPL